MIQRQKIFIIALSFFAAIFSYTLAAKADITLVQKLRFGEVVITNNNNQHSITINTDGSFSHAGSIININDPQPGIYQIEDLVPNSIIQITATQSQPLSAGGNFFTLKDFQIVHSNSDASGLANITLGATAQTSGNSASYDSRTYNGTIQIQINY